MGFGEADVATLAQTTTSDRLLVGAFNAGARRVLLAKRLGGLRGPRGL